MTPSLVIEDQHDALAVEIRRTLAGPVEVAAEVRSLLVVDSALDADDGTALVAPVAPVEVNSSTIVGTTAVQQLDASNSIFTGEVQVERRQAGCVRYCFVPAGSLTPRRYRCQPDLALADTNTAAEIAAVLDRMVPDFTAEAVGAPAYLQLTRPTPVEIRTGADDGSEMGLWWHLRQPQREANLRASLDEYLRLGLEAGLSFVT